MKADTPQPEPVPSLHDSSEKFLSAIATGQNERLRRRHVTGLTLPHHILAADLIAKGLATVDPAGVKTVIILSPDHFKKAAKPFATTRRDFETVFGRVRTSVRGVDKLLEATDLVETSALFKREHGIQVLLPFIKHYLPDAQIIPIAVALRSRRPSWDRMADLLARLIDPSTLVIQSTDFSHYLTAGDAAHHDQKVLNALALGDLDTMAQFRQPDDVDSTGSQYLQFKLQRDVFHAAPNVVYNSNSQYYSDVEQPSTTSYLVTLYEPGAPAHLGEKLSGSSTYCFAGDTFFGRWVAKQLDEAASARHVEEIATLLDGCPLIANLEGVVADSIPKDLRPTELVMSADLVRHWFRALHVVATSLANNHTKDLGEPAYEATRKTLIRAAIKPLMPFLPEKVGTIEVTAMTDLDNSSGVREGLIKDAQVAMLASRGPMRPRIAFLHWGREFEPVAGDRQKHLAALLGKAGFSLIVGAHPHRRSVGLERVENSDAIEAYSLGNFIFDQSASHASGAVLSVRTFRQGTFFARFVPIPNYFDRLRQNGTGSSLGDRGTK